MPDRIHAFYTSKPWRDLSFALKIKKGGKCERCGETLLDWSMLIGHHKIPLTESNIDNPNITLNPNNIEIICHKCHDKEHHRFGNSRQVYIVWGSPLSGKSTMVRDLIQYGDIVLDMDEIWQAITMQDKYIKPEPCRFNVFRLRDSLLDQIKTRYGQWYCAYIIGGYPDKYERERLSQSLGAELIYCESTQQECLDRRRESKKPEAWDKYITDWWDEYGRTGA